MTALSDAGTQQGNPSPGVTLPRIRARFGGVLLLPDGRLVSWGWDGAIRFWNQQGEPITGGDPVAHRTGSVACSRCRTGGW